MSAENLISRLDGVRAKGPGRWVAKCPAHADKTPSLTITELPDGRVLLYCHAMCAIESVLAAVGLDFDALYPEKPLEHGRRTSRPINHAQALAVIDFEVGLVTLLASDVAQGKSLSESDRARALTAAARIHKAYSLATA